MTLASWTLTPARLAGAAVVVALASLAAGCALAAFTPIRRLVPGFVGESQRAATENAIMRVDSLRDAYTRNEIYLANLRVLLDDTRTPSDSAAAVSRLRPLSVDSLLPRSPEEARFVAMMQDREKYNVTVRASIAAEDMLLYPVSDEGVVSQDSRDSYSAKVILPRGASVMAMADGSVIAAYFDHKLRTYVVLTQHDNGFVSRIAGLPSIMVGEGDILQGGEILCAFPRMKGGQPTAVSVSLWHNGTPVKPYEYIAGHRYRATTPSDSRRQKETSSGHVAPDSTAHNDHNAQL